MNHRTEQRGQRWVGKMTKADNVEQKGHGGSSTHQSPQVALGVHALVVFQEQLLRFDEGKRKKKKIEQKGG